MLPELNLRYEKLGSTLELAQAIGGERQVVSEGQKALKIYTKAKADKDERKQLESARELENIIGRLRASTLSSPKLSASEELRVLMDELETSVPSSSVTKPYQNAVKDFEQARTSWRLFISAVIGGYSAPSQLEFSQKTNS